MSGSWKTAFLEQARADYAVFAQFNRENALRCHQLHYLQMATEKLAKAFLAHESSRPPEKSHYVFVKFLQVCKRMPSVRKELKFTDARMFAVFIDSLLPLARRIEDLVPSPDIEKPNPEYPWIDIKTGVVIPPSSYGFGEYFSRDPKMAKMKQLINDLFQINL